MVGFIVRGEGRRFVCLEGGWVSLIFYLPLWQVDVGGGDEWKSDHILRLMECRNIDSTKTQEQQKRRATGQAEQYKSNERKKKKAYKNLDGSAMCQCCYLQHMTASVC